MRAIMSIGLVRTLRVHTSSRCHFNVCVSVLDSLVVHHIYFYVFFFISVLSCAHSAHTYSASSPFSHRQNGNRRKKKQHSATKTKQNNQTRRKMKKIWNKFRLKFWIEVTNVDLVIKFANEIYAQHHMYSIRTLYMSDECILTCGRP